MTKFLRPGGIIAFLEVDLTSISQVPPSEIFVRTRDWVLQGFASGGTELEMGSRLYATFRHAGLPAPEMNAVQGVFGGADAAGYGELVQALRSLLPAIARAGIAEFDDIGIDTLAQRLRVDAAANERVAFMSRLVAAWTRLP
ncbi:hypothetical protein [Novosphingobium sp. JCM 18896]|uniref:hypothetical protein n=1 Tax=Novosphingobium sp. JCM 18896 TaxID=2989731 RepID=UPI0039B5C22F